MQLIRHILKKSNVMFPSLWLRLHNIIVCILLTRLTQVNFLELVTMSVPTKCRAVCVRLDTLILAAMLFLRGHCNLSSPKMNSITPYTYTEKKTCSNREGENGVYDVTDFVSDSYGRECIGSKLTSKLRTLFFCA